MRTALVVIVLLLAPKLHAQTVTNPTTLEFITGSDHNAVDAFGQPIVIDFTYQAIGMNSNGAVVVTVGFAKPAAPNSSLVVMPVPGLNLMSTGKVYTATVAANSASGSAVSDPSNPFGLAGSTLPAKPSSVRVR